LLEVLNSPDDLGILHVACWIVIEANGQDSRMAALGSLDQEMEVFEIIMIPCQEHRAVPDGMQEMAWVRRTAQQPVGRHSHLAARFPEPGNQGPLGAVVIDEEIHALVGTATGAKGHWSRPDLRISWSSRARSASSRSLFWTQ
jgi:hypothetical protein